MGYDFILCKLTPDSTRSYPYEPPESFVPFHDIEVFESIEGLAEAIQAIAGVREASPSVLEWRDFESGSLTFYLDRHGASVDTHASWISFLDIYEALRATFPNLLILDKQRFVFHDAQSFRLLMQAPRGRGDA